jgi:hypothetical protein
LLSAASQARHSPAKVSGGGRNSKRTDHDRDTQETMKLKQPVPVGITGRGMEPAVEPGDLVAPVLANPADLEWCVIRRHQVCTFVQNGHIQLPFHSPNGILAIDERTLLIADTNTVWRVDLKRVREATAFVIKAKAHFKIRRFKEAKDNFTEAYKLHDDDEIRLAIAKCDRLLQ